MVEGHVNGTNVPHMSESVSLPSSHSRSMERPWPLSAHLLHPFAATLQVCSGLAFMHARRIVHCDLKPSNILSDGIDGSLVKVSDLGACLILPEGRDSLTVNTHVCTAPYQAPEVRSVPVPRLSSQSLLQTSCNCSPLILLP